MHAVEVDDLMQDSIKAVRNKDDDITQCDALDMELKSREQTMLSKFKKPKYMMEKHGYDAEVYDAQVPSKGERT